MNKTLLTLLALFGCMASLSAQVDSLPRTTVHWDSSFYEFGIIKEGKIITHVFTFSNSGPAPLVISTVKTSCGCTVPEWPKDTIPPGGAGEIKVTFNSNGKSGRQLKIIRVLANTHEPEMILQLGGEVKGMKRKKKSKG